MVIQSEIKTGYDFLRVYQETQPSLLKAEIQSALNAGGLTWREPPDGRMRWQNFDFLGHGQARVLWEQTWPAGEPLVWWDAVGKAQMGQVGWEWLLVNAWGQVEEFQRPGARLSLDGSRQAGVALLAAQRAYKVGVEFNWQERGGELTRRLHGLAFLRGHGLCARMLSIYFYRPVGEGGDCPTREEWQAQIRRAEAGLGLSGTSVLERRLYHLFLPAPDR